MAAAAENAASTASGPAAPAGHDVICTFHGWPSVGLVGVQENVLSGPATARKRKKQSIGQHLSQDPRTPAPPHCPGRPPTAADDDDERTAFPEPQRPHTQFPCENISPLLSQRRELQLSASNYSTMLLSQLGFQPPLPHCPALSSWEVFDVLSARTWRVQRAQIQGH